MKSTSVNFGVCNSGLLSFFISSFSVFDIIFWAEDNKVNTNDLDSENVVKVEYFAVPITF